MGTDVWRMDATPTTSTRPRNRAQHAARRYRRFRAAVLALQSAHRGRHARAQAFALRTEQKALLLQTWVRMALARARYRRFRRSVVALQCGHRRRTAKRLLRELRQEARAIGTLQRSNEKLKEELAELRCVAFVGGLGRLGACRCGGWGEGRTKRRRL